MALTGFNNSISWGQFQQRATRPPDAEEEDAFIRTRYNLNYARTERNGAFVAGTVQIAILVVAGQSWVVRGRGTAELLRHEQGHYDLQALAAREIHDRILSARATSAAMLDQEIVAVQREVNSRLDTKNIRYDDETDHGSIPAEQNRWENAIRQAKASSTGTLDTLP